MTSCDPKAVQGLNQSLQCMVWRAHIMRDLSVRSGVKIPTKVLIGRHFIPSQFASLLCLQFKFKYYYSQ